MGDSNSAVVGLLLLVPLILVIIIAYGAIKCSEWHIWTAHNLIGKRKRNRSGTTTSTEQDSSQEPNDLEKGTSRLEART